MMARVSGSRIRNVLPRPGTLSTSMVGPASVEVSHDGDPERAKRLFRHPPLGDLDGRLSLTSEPQGRTTVSLTIEQPERVAALEAP